jgi:hypothetical protein
VKVEQIKLRERFIMTNKEQRDQLVRSAMQQLLSRLESDHPDNKMFTVSVQTPKQVNNGVIRSTHYEYTLMQNSDGMLSGSKEAWFEHSSGVYTSVIESNGKNGFNTKRERYQGLCLPVSPKTLEDDIDHALGFIIGDYAYVLLEDEEQDQDTRYRFARGLKQICDKLGVDCKQYDTENVLTDLDKSAEELAMLVAQEAVEHC